MPDASDAQFLRTLARRDGSAISDETPEQARWSEMGRLAGGLTHELANPLAIILSGLTSVGTNATRLLAAGSRFQMAKARGSRPFSRAISNNAIPCCS